MWFMVGIFSIFGMMLIYSCIEQKTKDYLGIGVLCIVLSMVFVGLIFIDTNLDRKTNVIECVVTDKIQTGYLGSRLETTFLYNDIEFKVENNSLFKKVNKGDRVEMVVNFIRFNEEKYSIEYVTLINQ